MYDYGHGESDSIERIFFFSSRRRHTSYSGDWSSDVCSYDLLAARSRPHANLALYTIGVITAGLTAFYIFRLLFLAFHGAPRYDESHAHVHESPANMLEIGRASCRERGEISGVAVDVKKK